MQQAQQRARGTATAPDSNTPLIGGIGSSGSGSGSGDDGGGHGGEDGSGSVEETSAEEAALAQTVARVGGVSEAQSQRLSMWALVVVNAPQILAAILVLGIHWNDSSVCDAEHRNRWLLWASASTVRTTVHTGTARLRIAKL
jgi:hypothetical protein